MSDKDNNNLTQKESIFDKYYIQLNKLIENTEANAKSNAEIRDLLKELLEVKTIEDAQNKDSIKDMLLSFGMYISGFAKDHTQEAYKGWLKRYKPSNEERTKKK